MGNIKFFNEISRADVGEVGGKGASLGELTQAGLPVPPGFVITAEVYRQFNGRPIPMGIRKEIVRAFDELGAKKVAVRSSAIAEDSKKASWAGQLESFLNVKKEKLIEDIEKCWDSIKSERAVMYAAGQNVSKEQFVVAVVVQKMVESKVSGVMFTANPVNAQRNEIMIEACFGLGEMLVQGAITPDNFVVEKDSLKIKSKDIKIKKNKPTLTDKELKELAQLGLKIENHYKLPQDIEWAIDNHGKVWILQSRPITTL